MIELLPDMPPVYEPRNLKSLNIISVLRIILRRWSKSMTNALQPNTVFFGPT